MEEYQTSGGMAWVGEVLEDIATFLNTAGQHDAAEGLRDIVDANPALLGLVEPAGRDQHPMQDARGVIYPACWHRT